MVKCWECTCLEGQRSTKSVFLHPAGTVSPTLSKEMGTGWSGFQITGRPLSGLIGGLMVWSHTGNQLTGTDTSTRIRGRPPLPGGSGRWQRAGGAAWLQPAQHRRRSAPLTRLEEAWAGAPRSPRGTVRLRHAGKHPPRRITGTVPRESYSHKETIRNHKIPRSESESGKILSITKSPVGARSPDSLAGRSGTTLHLASSSVSQGASPSDLRRSKGTFPCDT